MADLLNCPFCGARHTLRCNAGVEWSGRKRRSILRLVCMNCRAAGPKELTKALAELAWNRRSPAPVAVPEDVLATARRILTDALSAKADDAWDMARFILAVAEGKEG